MLVPYLSAFLILLQPPQPPLSTVELKSGHFAWAIKIPLRYRSPREFDSLIGPILFSSQKAMTWPRRVQPRFGETSGMELLRSEWSFNGEMRPPGIDRIVALEDGSLLVQGDPADIDELTALVRALDFPIPSVECRLDVVRGKQKVLSASVSGKVGTVAKASNRVLGPATKAARIEVTFKILPLGVGRYEIESQGSVSVPLTKSGMRLEKTFQSTREFTPGQTLTLDRVEIGDETVQLLLAITLNPK
jgi:hypothetical protein